jgi:hypothetical protein
MSEILINRSQRPAGRLAVWPGGCDGLSSHWIWGGVGGGLAYTAVTRPEFCRTWLGVPQKIVEYMLKNCEIFLKYRIRL